MVNKKFEFLMSLASHNSRLFDLETGAPLHKESQSFLFYLTLFYNPNGKMMYPGIFCVLRAFVVKGELIVESKP